VAKDVRIKEEIAIGKKVEQRTETISDKVRHTEVEVLDERGNKVVPPARKVP
jgi:stress response protein YsnF